MLIKLTSIVPRWIEPKDGKDGHWDQLRVDVGINPENVRCIRAIAPSSSSEFVTSIDVGGNYVCNVLETVEEAITLVNGAGMTIRGVPEETTSDVRNELFVDFVRDLLDDIDPDAPWASIVQRIKKALPQ